MSLIEFKLQSVKNPQVYIEGEVEIFDNLGEDTAWEYYDAAHDDYTSELCVNHDGKATTGLTREQEFEIMAFKNKYYENSEFLMDYILQANEDENSTIERCDMLIIIGNGADD